MGLWTAPKKTQRIKGSTQGLSQSEIKRRSNSIRNNYMSSMLDEEELNITNLNDNDYTGLGTFVNFIFLVALIVVFLILIGVF